MATIHSHFRFFNRVFSFSTTFNLLAWSRTLSSTRRDGEHGIGARVASCQLASNSLRIFVTSVY